MQPRIAKHNKSSQTSATLRWKPQEEYADRRNPEVQNTKRSRRPALQNTIRIRRPAQPWSAKHNMNTRNPEMRSAIRKGRPAQPGSAKHNKNTQTSATLTCKTQEDYADQRNLICKAQCSCDIPSFISRVLKRPVHCAEHFLEMKICVSLQFCASDTPIPARRFIHQNINVRRTAVPCIPTLM